ncbi:hypothetical protein D9615_010365 [Tricholomella constricta]|uniref:DUF6534 domain-containing protein n=1 Tax=Tricholomella constricta TaxID=117010 RepID=A0A8H5GNB7_9AGAR|nr:hypothetical protein D9615_010365 [Tricholomella constricta]
MPLKQHLPISQLISSSLHHGSTGGSFIGNLLNYALMGVLAMQVYFYTLTFQGDRLALKSLDIIQTCFSTHYFWHGLVDGWGDSSPAVASWSLGTLTPLAGSSTSPSLLLEDIKCLQTTFDVVAFIVQTFFAWRIWVLKTSRWPSIQNFLVIIILVSDVALIEGELLQKSAFTGWLSISIVCDVLITVTLVVQLRAKRNRDFKYVNHVLHRAARMAIETGGLTCLIAIAELALFASWRNVHFFALIIISGKVYSNSLLASLNSRAPTFRKDFPPEDVEVWLPHSIIKTTIPAAEAETYSTASRS